MAKIAYVDHSYHRKTLSTDFLPEILRRHGHIVDYFWDDAWTGGAAVSWDSVAAYDVVIMFQAYCQFTGGFFRKAHPNVIYIPMLDQFGVWQGPLFNTAGFWEPFQGSKTLNFSSAVHAMVTGFGIKSHFVRYYQPVRQQKQFRTEGLRGFFWLRREQELPWSLVRTLIAESKFESFHIHLAADPGWGEPTPPTMADIERFNITTSTWFENKADFNTVLDKANVYFAPRLEEGIGQSFLEALSRGQCVVAANEGTMNEYIIDGVNGLLYDWKNPCPLDFSTATECGERALLSVKQGRKNWEAAEDDLVRYILTPSELFYVGKYNHSFDVKWVDCTLRQCLKRSLQGSGLFQRARFLWRRWKRVLNKFW